MTETRQSVADKFWLRPLVCTTVGLVGNIALTAGKLSIGYLAQSAALIADGFHSFADVASDLGIIVALKASARPPDENHPYGHHSFETLGAIGVAVLMLLTGLMIGKGAVERLWHHDYLAPQTPALVMSLISVMVKEVMARYTITAGKLHHSPALLTNGAMHRSDAISSLAAGGGIAGARLGVPSLDSVAALIIALFILRMGWQLARTNIMTLMDTMPAPELVEQMREVAATVPCAQHVRDIKIRQRGSYYLLDLRVAIHPEHTIESAHEVAHAVEEALHEAYPTITRVFVHIEPGERRVDADCRHVDASARIAKLPETDSR
jgi:cation diffusion facilitator family transporter